MTALLSSLVQSNFHVFAPTFVFIIDVGFILASCLVWSSQLPSKFARHFVHFLTKSERSGTTRAFKNIFSMYFRSETFLLCSKLCGFSEIKSDTILAQIILHSQIGNKPVLIIIGLKLRFKYYSSISFLLFETGIHSFSLVFTTMKTNCFKVYSLHS